VRDRIYFKFVVSLPNTFAILIRKDSLSFNKKKSESMIYLCLIYKYFF